MSRTRSTINPGFPPFRAWQLGHAKRHDPARYTRLRSRHLWAGLRAMAGAGEQIKSAARSLEQQLALINDRARRSLHAPTPAADLNAGMLNATRGIKGFRPPDLPHAWALAVDPGADGPPVLVRPSGEHWHFDAEVPRG